MKSLLRTLYACVLFVVASLTFGIAGATEPTVEEFNIAFQEANELRKTAGSLGHEWRDTAKILKTAAEAAQNGELEKAMELVAQAKIQGKEGIVQANRESSLWEGRVIR